MEERKGYRVEAINNPGCFWHAGSWSVGYGHLYATRRAAENSALVKRGEGKVVACIQRGNDQRSSAAAAPGDQ